MSLRHEGRGISEQRPHPLGAVWVDHAGWNARRGESMGSDVRHDCVFNRIVGALVGTILGDALGRPFEGTAAGDLERLRIRVTNRVATPKRWDYSDDAEMMLSVADSLLACRRVDESHLLSTMARSHEPARGYGKGTRAAFRTWRQTGSWWRAARSMWPEGSRGNGAAVRVAPLAVFHRDDELAVWDAARRSASPTHAHDEARDGAAVIASAVWLGLHGSSPTDSLRAVAKRASTSAIGPHLARIDLAMNTTQAVLACESVPLALWAHGRNQSFADAVLEAVCAAGDTHPTGAMTGALARATYRLQSFRNVTDADASAASQIDSKSSNSAGPRAAALANACSNCRRFCLK